MTGYEGDDGDNEIRGGDNGGSESDRGKVEKIGGEVAVMSGEAVESWLVGIDDGLWHGKEEGGMGYSDGHGRSSGGHGSRKKMVINGDGQ